MFGKRMSVAAAARDWFSTRRTRWARLAAVTATVAVMAPVLVFTTGSPAGAAKKLTTVTLEVPTVGAAFLPFYVGIDNGIYKKHGINLNLVSMSPPLAVDSILSGKLDFMAAIGSGGTAGLNGKPMRVYDATADRIDFVIVAPDSITSVSQLAGKTIVGESAVSEANLIEDQILQHDGVSPSSVTTLNVTGSNANQTRAALVLAGKAQATIVTVTTVPALKSQGIHVLANANFIVEPFTGLATSTTFASSHKKLLKQMIEATSQATSITKHNSAKVVKAFETAPLKTLNLKPAQAKAVWKTMRNEWVTNGVPSKVAINNQLSAWKTQYKLTSMPSASEVFDFSLAKSLIKKG